MIQPRDITGLILAGGRGSRMGGVDKGLQTFHGTPLAQHTLRRLQLGGGVGQCIINANRNLSIYKSFGVTVWPDELADFAGPLAGFLIGMTHCPTPFLVTSPCDSPLLPLDLVPRLAQSLTAHSADVAMVCAPETDQNGITRLRPQPVFCLLRITLRESLAQFTERGGRKIDDWTAQQRTVMVAFDRPGDDPKAFFNANTLTELRQLESPRA